MVPGAQTIRTTTTTSLLGITVADVDANSIETVSLKTNMGMLSATATGGATVSGLNSKALSISGSVAQVNATLATLTYISTTPGSDTISIVTSDGLLGNTRTIALTVSPTANHGPVIDATTTIATGGITERANTFGSTTSDTASGAIKFIDIDRTDTHTLTVSGVTASGAIAGLPANTTLLTYLTKGTVTEQTGTELGSAAWNFAAPDNVFDYLAAGQTATLTYLVTLADNKSGSTTQTVTVTITGTNDAPSATVRNGYTTDHWTPLTISAASLLTGATDPDLADTLSLASVQGAVGGTVALVGGNAVFTPTATKPGTASFTYTVSDGKGGTSTATANLTTTLHQINGTAANDTLAGGAKQAQIDGLAGNDTISAGSTGDILIGGAGNDLLNGGAGADIFVYHAGFGFDTVQSFTAAGTLHDTLQVDKTLFADWTTLLSKTKQVGTDLVITADAADTITLKNVALSSFTAQDATFV